MAESRKRNWVFVLYPDSAPEKLERATKGYACTWLYIAVA